MAFYMHIFLRCMLSTDHLLFAILPTTVAESVTYVDVCFRIEASPTVTQFITDVCRDHY